jgi:hypothetical protein
MKTPFVWILGLIAVCLIGWRASHVVFACDSSVASTLSAASAATKTYSTDDLLPTVATLKGKNGVYTITLPSGLTKKIRPFSPAYTGGIWARIVTFGDVGSLYIFGNQDEWAKGAVVVYNGAGSRMQTVKPFGTATKWGMNFDITVETMTNSAYVAIGTKKGLTARLYKFITAGLGNEKKLTAVEKKGGSVVPQFLRLSSDNTRSLITIVNKRKSSIRVWVYDPTDDTFVRDTQYPLSNLKVTNGKVERTW